MIVPASTLATLREITAQLRFRAKVYESWGMAARNEQPRARGERAVLR